MDPRIRDFLDEERAARRPFEALAELGDAELDEPIPAAHDWSGRDLIAHLVGWLGDALDVAHELERGASSPARERSRRAFAARGDEINAEIQASWRGLPLDEVRRRMRDVPDELRRAMTVVPASSWDADPGNLQFFEIYTIEHYEDHIADLAAVLAAAGVKRQDAPA
jgi:hypothetical protein